MKSKKTTFVLLILIFCMACILFTGCERIREAYGNIRSRDNIEAPVPVFAVNTMPASQGPIQDYLTLSGDIIASSTVDTFSDVAGRISRVYVTSGRRVNRGDPIVDVDPSRPGMEFIHSVVRAPVSGTIVSLPAQMGMTISQATPLARITGGAGLEIRLFVAERFISRVSLNQPCEIRLDAWPGQVFRGAITEVSPTLDPVSRTMEIRVGVENPGAVLKTGMFARVRIITERKDNIVKIPIGAMVSRFGEQFVFTVDYSDPDMPVARRKTIVPGIQIDGVMEVSEGLLPNEEVIVRGQTLLEDGSRINIIDRLAAIAAN